MLVRIKAGDRSCWTCRDHGPDVSAALTTVAFDQSGPRWLGIGDLIAEPEGPTFISYKVARSRLDRLRFVTQDPGRTWPNSTRTCLLVTSHNFRRFLGTCHRYRCSVIAEVRKRPTSPVPNECVDLKQVNRRNVSSRSSFWFVNSNLEKSHGYGSKRARQSYRQRQG